MNTKKFLLLAPSVLLSFGAQALELAPGGMFLEGGLADHSGYSVTAGVVWPWAWRRQSLKGEVTGITEAYVSHWNARGSSGREAYTQLGLVPLLRYRGDQGRSAWFFEGGIGISIMDRSYITLDKQFSTRWNFVDVLGVGRSLGPDRRRELSLRYSHISNAGIKKPNPGEDFLQLRYAVMF